MQSSAEQPAFLRPPVETTPDFVSLLKQWTVALEKHKNYMKHLAYVDDEYIDTKSKIEWAAAFVDVLSACVRNEENAIAAYTEFIEKQRELERAKIRAARTIENAREAVVRAQSVIRFGAW